MKSSFLLLFSVLLLLSGCSEKQQQQVSNDSIESPSTSKLVGDQEPAPVKEETPVPQKEPLITSAKEESKPVEQPSAQKDSENQTTAVQHDTNLKANTPKVAPVPTPANPSKAQTEPPSPVPVAKPAAPPPPPLVAEKTVNLSVRGDKDLGVILAPTEVIVVEGDTVLKVLTQTLKDNKIPMEYRGSGGMAYIEGIANLYEFDRGPTSGWMFRINGVFGSQSAGSVKLQPGDQVEWLYTLDLGKDIGAQP